MRVEILVDGSIRESLGRTEADLMVATLRKFKEEMGAPLKKEIANSFVACSFAYHAADWMETRPI